MNAVLAIPVERKGRSRAALRVKHAFDRTAALLAIVLLAPVLVTIACAIRLGGSPVFFRHERIGLDGRPFLMWKFRTMTSGAEDRLAGLLRACGRAGEPLFKVPGDPRITPFGRILRRWSLDELPQLFNVLCGQMSLVGPRPQVAAEVALYDERERGRLCLRPGITGLWQISGRSELPWDEAVEYDLRYVEDWSLWLDAVVLARTVGAVLSGRGAW